MEPNRKMKRRFCIKAQVVLPSGVLSACALTMFGAAFPCFAQSGMKPNEPLIIKALAALQQRENDVILYDVKDAEKFSTNPVRTTKYQWALSGPKLYQKRQDSGGQWHTSVYDGKTEQEVTYRRGQQVGGAIGEVKTAKDSLLLGNGTNIYEGTYRIGDIWISDLLRGGKFSAKHGSVIKPFGQTVEIVGTGTKQHTYHLTLAPDHNWMCIRAKVTSPGEDKTVHEDEYFVTADERRNGVWFPTQTRISYYLKDGSAPRELFLEHNLQGTIVKTVNLPGNLFVFQAAPEGARVLDFDTMRDYKIEKGQMVSTDNKFTPSNGRVWTFVLSAGAFVAGGLLLFSKFMRRRNLPG